MIFIEGLKRKAEALVPECIIRLQVKANVRPGDGEAITTLKTHPSVTVKVDGIAMQLEATLSDDEQMLS
jgi:hypothetical protein